MKVQVKDKQGIDEQGNKHPAPGITDGPHECELKWQWKDTIRGDWSILLGSHLDNKGNPTLFVTDDFPTRQIWVLAEQDKEGKTADPENIGKHLPELHDILKEAYYLIQESNPDTDAIILAALMSAFRLGKKQQSKQTITSSTRIAELSARVAELEGVLKEIQVATDEYRNYSHLLKSMQVVNTLATNALKNQQP